MLRRTIIGLAALAFSAAFAFALTVPPTFVPRTFYTQQTGYFRVYVTPTAINGQACPQGTWTATGCTIKIGAVPYNAYVIRATLQIPTNFNSASGTDTLSLGTNATAVNLLAAIDIHTAQAAGTVSTAKTIAAGGNGTQLTGATATQTGKGGGFDLYVQLLNAAGAAPAAGEAILIIEWIAPNDGSCTDVPLGATAAAC